MGSQTEAEAVYVLKGELNHKSVNLDTFYGLFMMEDQDQLFGNWVNSVCCHNWVIGSGLLFLMGQQQHECSVGCAVVNQNADIMCII